jgi:hypothetical protein
MIGVMKKITCSRLPTICATSRKRAASMPSSSPIQAPLAATASRASGRESAHQLGATSKITATMT